jgi:hypothetical protein
MNFLNAGFSWGDDFLAAVESAAYAGAVARHRATLATATMLLMILNLDNSNPLHAASGAPPLYLQTTSLKVINLGRIDNVFGQTARKSRGYILFTNMFLYYNTVKFKDIIRR